MNREIITGAVLAGGRSARMGGRDKGLVSLGGRPLIEHVLDRLRPQVGSVTIVANRNRDCYRRYGAPVVADDPPAYAGPLAGIAAALRRSATPYVLIVPCDGPLLPHDLARRLYAAIRQHNADIAAAATDGRLQPLFALLRSSLLTDLHQFLDHDGRAVHEWYARHALARVDFSSCAGAFVNLNTPQDLASCSPLPPGEGTGVRVGIVNRPAFDKTLSASGTLTPTPLPEGEGLRRWLRS